jgi:predicted dehydrogenase
MRWGILGLGKIAGKFAEDLRLVDGAELVAVASRSVKKADEFGARFGATYRFGTYEELVECPDVDVVYIASPHSEHHAHTLLCLHAGKAVLCEKAFAFNARQAAEMVAVARERNLFLMEAIWTRFLPATLKTLELVNAEAIGAPVHVAADFGFVAPFDPASRLYNPALAGGSLLDIGLYPLFISTLLLGHPSEIRATGTLAPTGVDLNCAMALRFSSGATASLASTLAARTQTTCTVYGTKGYMQMHARFHEATGLTLVREGRDPEIIETGREGAGYCYEARHVEECLRRGLTESPLLPLSFSLRQMECLDEIRRQLGVRYPADDESD